MQLQRYFDVSQASDVESFRSSLISFAHQLGFPLMTASVVIDGNGPREAPVFHSVSNMPDAFKDASADPAASRRDPINRRLRTLSVPVVYDQTLYVSEGAADLWESQAAFGYRCGIAVALHLPAGKHFLLGVDRDVKLPKAEDKMVKLMGELQLLAVHAQAAALRFLTPTEQLPRPSPRELEVLRWIREGKSTWEIGNIIGISEATVNFHVANVVRKLSTSGRHQAVLKAINQGWIV